MAVPMVQIRPVSVLVLPRPMFVPVEMLGVGADVTVRMIVVAIVMPVPMLVRHGIVPVNVGVSLAEQQRQGPCDQTAGQHLEPGE